MHHLKDTLRSLEDVMALVNVLQERVGLYLDAPYTSMPG